jgi:hypothetical protein
VYSIAIAKVFSHDLEGYLEALWNKDFGAYFSPQFLRNYWLSEVFSGANLPSRVLHSISYQRYSLALNCFQEINFHRGRVDKSNEPLKDFSVR